MDEIARQRQFEEQFLNQLRARAEALTKGTLPADRLRIDPMPDGIEGVKATLRRLEVYDSGRLHSMPGTRAMQMVFQKSLLGGLYKPVLSRVRVRVLAPIEALVKNTAVGAVDREQVLDALAQFDILPRAQRPTAVVLASPTGFTASARAMVHTMGPPTLILLGGRSDGGWEVDIPQRVANTPWRKLFELETQDGLLNRLMHHLESNADLVDSRGMSMEELAARLGIEKAQVEALVRRAVRANGRLLTVQHEGRIHVARTPLDEERRKMGLWSRIRRLLRLPPTAAEKVRQMTEQRVKLEQQRHELDSKVRAFEAEEVGLIKQGAGATTDVEKKQLAGRLVRLRRELGRHKSQAEMLTKQIDIIGTHIHHLTLTERGRRMELPKAEELTREAAQAEHMMAELNANAELAAGIEVGAESTSYSEEEADVLAEFAAAAKQSSEAESSPVAERTSGSRAPAAGAGAAASAGRAVPPPVPATPAAAAEKQEKARPEIG